MRAVDAFDGGVSAYRTTTLGLVAGVFGGVVISCTNRAGGGVGAFQAMMAVLLAVFALGGGGDGVVFRNLECSVKEVDIRDAEGF